VQRDLGNLALALPARAPGLHLLHCDAALRIEDYVCDRHARSPVSEHAHARSAIAVVLGGTFHVRGSAGEALLGPGALLLKNTSTTHEYRHVEDRGDRSVTFEFTETFIEGVRDSFGIHRHRGRAFDHLAIPPATTTAAAVALTERALRSGDAHELEDAALAVAAAGFTTDWRGSRQRADPSLAQTRRVAHVLRYVDAHSAEDCSIAALAEVAGFSPFHFARVFQALTGQTPRQHVIAVRLRAAATALLATRTPVTQIAFDAGFGDVSHFTTSFRRAFGVSPRRYRQQHCSHEEPSPFG
jgi:AraC family transcriptional regulator